MPTIWRMRADGIPLHRHNLIDTRDSSGMTWWHEVGRYHPRDTNAHARTNAYQPQWVGRGYMSNAMFDVYLAHINGQVHVHWTSGRAVTTTQENLERAVNAYARENLPRPPHVSDLHQRAPQNIPEVPEYVLSANGIYVPCSLTERRFGVEIECFTPKQQMLREINSRGVTIHDEGYNHVTRNYWKVVTDGSLSRSSGMSELDAVEIVSPPLRGEEGIRQLRVVSDALVSLGTKVNSTCGLHVHHDGIDLSVESAKTMALNYYYAQSAIDKLVAESRRSVRSPQYCHPFSSRDILDISRYNSLNSVVGAVNRYHTLNLSAYLVHKTVEFRQHQGSFEFHKIAAWIELTQLFAERSLRGKALGQAISQLDDLFEFVEAPDALQSYYQSRANELLSSRRT